MCRRIAGLLASLVLSDGVTSADTSQRRTAILVEVHSIYKCVGLDCPHWPVPVDSEFCFQAGDNFYSAIHHPGAVPWATKDKRLLALKGKTVEIVVTDKYIQVVAPRINLRLQEAN